MEDTSSIDLEQLAKRLKLDLASVQSTIELLEVGNTVPFITRFRKDQTRGLDDQQVRTIQHELSRCKQLNERKESILKSVASRQQLTAELEKRIRSAHTMSELEDVYLPFKPKKKSLAYIARSRGLAPLAEQVLAAKPGETGQLEELTAKYVDAEKELADQAAVLAGVQHLIAEHFCNHAELRAMLRQHLWKNGKLVSKKLDQPDAEMELDSSSAEGKEKNKEPETDDNGSTPKASPASEQAVSEQATSAETTTKEAASETPTSSPAAETAGPSPESSSSTEVAAEKPAETTEKTPVDTTADNSEAEGAEGKTASETTPSSTSTTSDTPAAESKAAETAKTDEVKPATPTPDELKAKKKAEARDQRRATRRRRRERLVQSFKDYFNFSDPLGKLPHHRILAINRGERTKVLRVRIECDDWSSLEEGARSKAFAADHPHSEFLGTCLQDSLNRLLIPSIEREVRRELNEKAEEHAVKVFAKNLQKLLLQPPLHQHRVVAIDPGYRSGCKVVALDEFGKMLGHTFINLLGKDQQKEQGRTELAKFVKEHKATVIAVGNGAACRETEALVGELLSKELRDDDVGYLIVNEAGTSVYSTSETGREELPDVDPTVRSAVSIGRRALDPLSELVKVDPASIGVGLYQHDVKAKHLRDSLDEVVESCVNYVGVDVNSASPSLLRYVSGLNKMTANQIYKHRETNGPFKNREELKNVSGVGDSSYVQAAGFLKIAGGENPLDETWIHPESYPIAERVLKAIGFESADLLAHSTRGSESPQVAETETTPESAPSADTETQTEEPQAAEQAESATVTEATETQPVEDEKPAEPVTSTTDASATEKPPIAVASSTPVPDRLTQLRNKLESVEVDRLAPQLDVGKLLLQDILTALARPGRDPREDLPRPPFRKGVLKLEDLEPGMELTGTVLNVVDFGAFVDIGLVDSGLVHVSRLADKFISDPHEVVSVGDILRIWVVEVDQNRRRVSLTAIEPGTEKPKRRKSPRKPRDKDGSSDDKSNRRSGGDGKSSQPRGKGRRPGGRKPRDDRKGRGGGRKPREYRAKTAPKPVVPITKEMEEGKEPMRTFGDLKQLFEKKKGKGDDK